MAFPAPQGGRGVEGGVEPKVSCRGQLGRRLGGPGVVSTGRGWPAGREEAGAGLLFPPRHRGKGAWRSFTSESMQAVGHCWSLLVKPRKPPAPPPPAG